MGNHVATHLQPLLIITFVSHPCMLPGVAASAVPSWCLKYSRGYMHGEAYPGCKQYHTICIPGNRHLGGIVVHREFFGPICRVQGMNSCTATAAYFSCCSLQGQERHGRPSGVDRDVMQPVLAHLRGTDATQLTRTSIYRHGLESLATECAVFSIHFCIVNFISNDSYSSYNQPGSGHLSTSMPLWNLNSTHPRNVFSASTHIFQLDNVVLC